MALDGPDREATARKGGDANIAADLRHFAFEAIPTMCFVVDEAGLLAAVNDFGAQTLGYGVSDLVGQPWLSLFHEQDRGAVGAHAADCFRELGRVVHREARQARRDGEIVHVRETGRAVLINDRPMLVIACENVTERKRQEEALRQSELLELQLRVSMLQNIPVAAWSVTPDGTPDIVNQLWYEYTGQTPEYVNSRPDAWMTTMHPEDRERAARIYWDGILSGQGFTMEARFLRAKDGTYRWHLNRAVPVRDSEGNILRLVGTSTDVHDLRVAQEELRNTETRFAHMTRVITMGELTASIAHEVNQPLGAIVTGAAACMRWLAAEPPRMDKARKALERIANDGRRAAEVIQRIRALMKRQAPRKDWLDINGTILEVLELTQHKLRHSEIRLETRLADNLPLIRGDRVHLQQVLLNLIVNAVEAMSGIERRRLLTILSALENPQTVRIEICDTGSGLEPEFAARLFEPFYTTKAEGLGIGLSTSRSIVEAHGGQLGARANAPRGAVFWILLPVNESVP